MALEDFLKKKLLRIKDEKVVQNPGVIGHYDSKPFHNFKYALIYANEVNIVETPEVEIYSRVFKDKATFVNVLINDEKNINDLSQYKYENIKPMLVEKGIKVTEKSVVVICFEHYNQKTVDLARGFCESNKKQFEQALIYNPRLVQMDFYRPVPKFYSKMYEYLCEDLYFDFAFIDNIERDERK
ncbi:MAG: hypothetical protein IKP77_01340 [Acholeplasmatales bacterium]|nr:hypothetical protein [Acholeplasmatales bacterium]